MFNPDWSSKTYCRLSSFKVYSMKEIKVLLNPMSKNYPIGVKGSCDDWFPLCFNCVFSWWDDFSSVLHPQRIFKLLSVREDSWVHTLRTPVFDILSVG